MLSVPSLSPFGGTFNAPVINHIMSTVFPRLFIATARVNHAFFSCIRKVIVPLDHDHPGARNTGYYLLEVQRMMC